MNKPSLTVLMPVYNAEKFLDETVQSILNQTFSDFEFLIIDNGSIDSTVKIIESYTDSRIRLVKNKENAGISAVLNQGIELASTELIARMDADDISYPRRLEKQYEFFIKNPECALLSTWAREITENKEEIHIEKFKSAHYYYNLTFACWIYHPTVMYKRSAVIDVGKYSVPYSEDFDLWWKISRKYKICNLEEVLLDYRATSESLCRVTNKNNYENAHNEVVLRNIRYYAGEDFHLTNSELECLQFNVEPLAAENNLRAIVECLNKFDRINQYILKKDNVNRNEDAVKTAAHYKKEFIILYLREKISLSKFLRLLIRLGYWKKLSVFLAKLGLGKIRIIDESSSKRLIAKHKI